MIKIGVKRSLGSQEGKEERGEKEARRLTLK
jgi:hypothetical protein